MLGLPLIRLSRNNRANCLSPTLVYHIFSSENNLSQRREQTQRRLNTAGCIKPLDGNYDWSRTISEAKRIVGYPTSTLTLRWLLSDEVANLAEHMRKFAASQHPLLKTSRYFLNNEETSIQVWGLLILLLSKAAGHNPSIHEMEIDKSTDILHSQRALAEITEMICKSHLIHASLVNLQKTTAAGQDLTTLDDMSYGNKICLLLGDYLLSASSVELSSLRNQEVMALITSAIRDFTESEFIGDRDEQNNPLPWKSCTEPIRESNALVSSDMDFDDNEPLAPLNTASAKGNVEKEWEIRNTLSAGSLLGKSLKSAMILANNNKDTQRNAYLFGKHLHLSWRACLELASFQISSPSSLDSAFSLVSAPVLYHLEYDSELYLEIERGKVNVNDVDYAKIRKIVSQGPGLERTEQLRLKHTAAALNALEHFPSNDARKSMEYIVLCIKDRQDRFE